MHFVDGSFAKNTSGAQTYLHSKTPKLNLNALGFIFIWFVG